MVIPRKTVKAKQPCLSESFGGKQQQKLSTKRRQLLRLKTSLSGRAFKVNSEKKSEKQRNSIKKAEFQFQTGNMRDAWKHQLDTPSLN